MIPTTVPIPNDLSNHLPNPNTPWLISPSLFFRIQNQPHTDQPFRLEEVHPSDPEAAFVQKYFCHQQPLGHSIRQIFCIHNPSHTLAFENELKNMELESKKFIPQGAQEFPQEERRATIHRWENLTTPFSPIEIQGPKRTDRFVKAKSFPSGKEHLPSNVNRSAPQDLPTLANTITSHRSPTKVPKQAQI